MNKFGSEALRALMAMLAGIGWLHIMQMAGALSVVVGGSY